MNVSEVRLDAVDMADETYRISEVLDLPKLESSLREVGQVNPVVLASSDEDRFVVVCGFRRLRALRRLGMPAATARVLPKPASRPLEAFRLALWDNLAHRQLQPLEIARVLFALRHTCGLSRESLIDDYLPSLGLTPRRDLLETYLGLNTLDSELRTQLSAGRLSLAAAGRLATKPPMQQASFATFLSRVRLTASMQRQFLDMVEEIGARDNRAVEAVLSNPELQDVLADTGLSGFQKGERVYEILYRERYPRIAAAEVRFTAERRKMGLPGNVRLTHDRFFETSSIRVEFDADSPVRFRSLASALERASRTPVLDALFDLS